MSLHNMRTSTLPLLQIKNVSHSFGGLRALSDVTFDVQQGEILALIGPNGAGKSTVLNVVSGFIRNDSGEILFKGQRLEGLAPSAVNKLGLARTFQAAEILDELTVCENVMAAMAARETFRLFKGLFGRNREPMVQLKVAAISQLALVGLEDIADQSAALLTAGQRRLLAAARALATGAELLLLDEPAAGLNTVEKNRLAEVVLRIKGTGVTVVFVEHDLGFVSRLAERMVVLDHGKVIARGQPKEVRSNPLVLEAYLGDTDVVSKPRDERTAFADSEELLSVLNVTVQHGSLTALSEVSLKVYSGEIVALIGANGAGKSTMLNLIAGLNPATSGEVTFCGKSLNGVPREARPAMGICTAPEGRKLFSALTVRDNLLMGRYGQIRKAGLLQTIAPFGATLRELNESLEYVLDFFPRLRERLEQQAGTLSGGEAQMLAIGRALMGRPSLLMLDEPSFGIAPKLSREILEALPSLTKLGITVLMVEQNARSALQIADRAYVLANGKVVAQGPSSELARDKNISEAYLGWDKDVGRSEDETAAAVPALQVA